MNAIHTTTGLADAASGFTATPRVSVIIPALNEERHIGRCLNSLVRLKFPRGDFEVILVDNGSTDATVTITHGFTERLDLRVLQRERCHISALRNLGAKHARGEFLAFLDADCVAPPNWLSDATGLLDQPGVGVVGAHYRLPDESSWVARTWDRYHFAVNQGPVSFIPAGNMLLSRSNFVKVGGFDESIQTNEDAELCERIRQVGLPVTACQEIRVVHYGTSQTLRQFYRRERWHGTHVFTVFLRSVGRSGNLRVISLALYTLLCEMGILFGFLLGFLSGHWMALLIALLLLLLPAIGLGIQKTVFQKRAQDLPALSTLYLVYGIARAHCIANIRNWAFPVNQYSGRLKNER